MTDDERSQRIEALIGDYLRRASAREQHIYVARANYDGHSAILQQLADEPGLERATALRLFWSLGADYHARVPADQLADHERESEALLRLIESRYVSGYYGADTLYYGPRDADNDVLPDEYASMGPVVRPIAAPMYEPTQGREWVDVDDAAYDDGLPAELVEQIDALFEDEDEGESDDAAV